MNIKTVFTVLAAVSTVACGPAFSDEGASLQGKASYAIALEGYVPVICRASVERQTVPVTEGQVDLGAMTEFCNSPNGYQVWVDHDGALDGAIHVDGRRIGLSPTGATLISTSQTAAFRTRQLAFEGADGQTAALSLRITPL